MRLSVIRRYAVALVLFASFPAYSAAWLQDEGRLQLINNFTWYSTESFFNTNGDRLPQAEFTKLEYNPYAEYGLSKETTVGISTSFQSLSQGSQDNSGLGDTEIFFRKQLFKDDWTVISYQPLIKIPGFYSETRQPLLGNKQIDVELRALYGTSFQFIEQYHYVNLELAYRRKFEKPQDEIRFDATLGFKPKPDILLLAQIFSIFSVDTANVASFQNANSTDFDLTKLQLSAVKDLSETMSVQLGIFRNLRGRNTGSGGGVLLSVWLKF